MGMPAESLEDVSSVFFNLGAVMFGTLAANVGLIFGAHWYWIHGIVSTFIIFLLIFVNLAYFVFSVIVCGNTRWSLRRRNNIPQVFELADYLLSLFHLPFVVAQLGRHTVDYGQLEAHLCSATGLFPGVEVPSESKYIQPQIVSAPSEGSFMQPPHGVQSQGSALV
jgi:hypothetical protein